MLALTIAIRDEPGTHPVELNQRKEQFSRAFIHAIASVAGYTIYRPEVDDDSVDLGIAARGDKATRRSPRLEMQVKCSAEEITAPQIIPFRLKRKNYDDLRRQCWTPRILVVLFVPQRLRDLIKTVGEQMRHELSRTLALAAWPRRNIEPATGDGAPAAPPSVFSSVAPAPDAIN